MENIKASLKVVLQANETIVAESSDAALWQRVFAAITSLEQGTTVTQAAFSNTASKASNLLSPLPDDSISDTVNTSDEFIRKFALALGLDTSTVIGACSPSTEPPYLTLDRHCWSTLKEKTPQRGGGSLSPMAMAATLLAIWAHHAKLGQIKQGDGQQVLATIDIRDNNALRSIKSADWLQSRSGGVIVINPAKMKKAVAVAKAFCSQEWSINPVFPGAGE
jgi:hypothetical protein